MLQHDQPIFTCLLDGVATPMVLRGVADQYHRIIGSAEVEGFIKDRAFALDVEGLFERKTFRIK